MGGKGSDELHTQMKANGGSYFESLMKITRILDKQMPWHNSQPTLAIKQSRFLMMGSFPVH
jgi:hypothetical protein